MLDAPKHEISSFDAMFHNRFGITKVTAVQAPDLRTEFESWIKPVPRKPGLKITFKTTENRTQFQNDIRNKLDDNIPESPFLGVTIYLTEPTVILDIKRIEGVATLKEQFAPALEFLTEHYPGFDFEGSISAQLTAEPTFSNPAITPGLHASRKSPVLGSAPDTMCEKSICRIL